MSGPPGAAPPTADRAAGHHAEPGGDPPGHAGQGHAAREGAGLVKLFVGASILVALVFGVVRPFVGDVHTIASDSMTPTLEGGERVLTNKLAYRLGDPAAGDLVLFERAGGEGVEVKRVAAVGGDRVEIRDGRLLVNGARREEPYVDLPSVDSSFFGPVTVPEGSVFLLGDNRAESRDSRHYGPLPEDDVLGEVLVDF